MEEAIDRAQTFQHNAVAIHGSASSSRHDSHRRGSQGPAVRVNAVGRYSRYEQPPRSKDASRRSTPGASPATSPAGRGTGTHHPSSAGSGPSSSMDTEAKLDVLVAGVSELSGKLDQVCESLRRLTMAIISPNIRRSPSPRRSLQCFRCRKEGHVARECLEPGSDGEGSRRLRDPLGNKLRVSFEDEKESLNTDGSVQSA